MAAKTDLIKNDTANRVRVVDYNGHEADFTEDGLTRVSISNLVFWDRIVGSNVDTRLWTQSSSNMTIVQSGGFVRGNL